MDQPILKVEKIDVSYRDVKVLHEIDLEVYPSEIVTVIGPNGAGKSTLLSAIIGFQAPNKGSISFRGHTITGVPPEETVKLGITILLREPGCLRKCLFWTTSKWVHISSHHESAEMNLLNWFLIFSPAYTNG